MKSAEHYDADARQGLPPARVYVDAEGRETIARTFFTMRDLAELADKLTVMSRHRKGEPGTFYGENTFDECVAMGRGDGLQNEEREEIAAIAAHVSRIALATRTVDEFAYRLDTFGAEVDVDRYLANEIECVRDAHPTRIARQGRVVRILVPVTYNGGTSVESIRRRGAAIAALIDALASSNYSCEIWAMGVSSACEGPASRLAYAVQVQSASTPLDIERVAFALCHAGILRRLIFAARCMEGADVRQRWSVPDGMGIAPRWTRIEDLPEDLQRAPAIVLAELEHDAHLWSNGDLAAIAQWVDAQASLIANADAVST
jgi:hypothetical protein